ncbi:MAG TPA: hypothetical protein VD862_04100 [Candidatus Paceibacterota bacterium]|nr:hypothetical protein [Candidatus Paceibacterota bacterium]
MDWQALSEALKSYDLDALLLSATDVRGLFAVLAGVIVFLYGISVGKTRAILSLLSIYVAYALTLLFPSTQWLEQLAPENDRPLVLTGLFVVLYLAVFGLLNLSVLKRRLTLGELSIPKVLLVSVVQIGLLASVTVSLLPPELTNETLDILKPYLAGRGALFGWAVLAVVILPFMREKRRSGGMTVDG